MNILFFTDGPPLTGAAHGNHGNHGIADNLIRCLGNHISLVSTRRLRRQIKRRMIEDACHNIPLCLIPDTSGLGIRRFLPRFATFLDLLSLALFLPILAKRARRLGVERILFLCGADGSWLIAVKLLQLIGFPVDLYVVDDLERFAVVNRHLLRRFTPKLFGHVARRCGKVYAISQGYADQIKRDHSVDSIWLPIPIADKPYQPQAYKPCHEPVRNIVYSGAINHLYKDAIEDLYQEIIRHNESAEKTYELHLVLMTYGNPSQFIKTLPHQNYVTGYQNLSEEDRVTMLREGFASFLPYSFKLEEQKMVSTSFSCKIIEYFKSGRPIIVYGPPYASIPRYFRENDIPLTATTRQELKLVLDSLCKHDKIATLDKYEDLWRKHHSPEAWRSIF